MANSITLNTMSGGSVVATDQAGTDHYQIIKIADGTEDSIQRVSASSANGLEVDVTRVQGSVTITGSVAQVGTYNITGTVATTGTQTISGTVTVSNTRTNVNATVTNAGTFAVQAAQTLPWSITVSNPTTSVSITGGSVSVGNIATGLLTVSNIGTTSVTGSVATVGTVDVTGSVAVVGAVTISNTVTNVVVTNTVTNVTVSGSVSVSNAVTVANTITNITVSNTNFNIASSLESSSMYSGATALTPKFAVIDDNTSGDNEIVAAVAGKKLRVLSVFMISSSDVNVRFEAGAGGTALTGQMTMTQYSGFVLPFNPVGWFETSTTNTNINLELSAAVSVDGSLTYVEV